MNLFIDTHLNDVIVVLENNRKIINQKIIKDKKNNSTIIMPTIKEVLEGKKPDSIIVVNGPGSFTGVRLGVTIAKTLAYTMNIPVRTISSLECMAICNTSSTKTVAFSDNNGYYIRLLEEEKIVYNYLSNSEFSEFIKKNEVIENVNLDYLKIIDYVLKKDAINPHQVNPVYIKKITIEKWLD